MKTILLLLFLGAVAYFGYREAMAPGKIANPVFAEVRIDISAGGRDIEAVIFCKAADEQDCQSRTEITRRGLQKQCPECRLRSAVCKPALNPRYASYFDDAPANATFLSLDPVERGQREIRLVFWGLTRDEGIALCEKMKSTFQEIHQTPARCVLGKA